MTAVEKNRQYWESLLPFCKSQAQADKIQAMAQYGSQRKAADFLGLSPNAIFQSIQIVERNSVTRGWSPEHDMTHIAPEGFSVKGTSTLYDSKTGEPKIQWVKTNAGAEHQLEMMQEAVDEMCTRIKRVKPLKAPEQTLEHLLNLYTLSDAHLNMLAWREEGGENWDMDIAERVLVGSLGEMIRRSPDAEVGFINQGGDWMHSDGFIPVTPTAKNVLDQDGRFGKAVRASIRIFRQMIDMALQKHNRVHVLLQEGNHDPASSVWLREMFVVLYEDEPRVTVETSQLPYYSYEWGKTALFFHHGHLTKFTSLAALFAAEFAPIWGRCPYRFGHSGHMHHKASKDDIGTKNQSVECMNFSE